MMKERGRKKKWWGEREITGVRTEERDDRKKSRKRK